MIELQDNIYYKRLSKLALWPLVGLVVLVFFFTIGLLIVFYMKNMPDLLTLLLDQSLSIEILSFVETSINRIVIYLSVWLLVLFLMNILLIYVIWNIKKLLALL